MIERSQDWFRRAQFDDGFWWAELESNATMDAEYILMTHFLGAARRAIWRGVAQDIRGYQRDDGSWALYDGAPGDLSTTIECYFALRLAGDIRRRTWSARASFILARGGIGARSRVHPDLARAVRRMELGRPAGDAARADAAAAARADQHLSVRVVGPRDDRAAADPDERPPGAAGAGATRASPTFAWLRPRPASRATAIDRVFLAVDVRAAPVPSPAVASRCARRARERAERWILDHQEADGSWGGIQPPWVYSLMALHALGYAATITR